MKLNSFFLYASGCCCVWVGFIFTVGEILHDLGAQTPATQPPLGMAPLLITVGAIALKVAGGDRP